MKVIVTTESGTKYTFGPEDMSWKREGKTLRWLDRDAGPTEGILAEFPEIYIGERMYIIIKDPDSGPDAEAPILSSRVKNFENVED